MSCDVGEVSSAHSPRFQSLHLRHSSFWFSKLSVTSPTSHSSFSNPSLALPTSQLILQRFRCFTYVTAHCPTLLSPLLRHRIFTYFTWRAAYGKFCHGSVLVLDSLKEHQHIKLETRVQAPVQDIIFIFQFCNRISIFTLCCWFSSLPSFSFRSCSQGEGKVKKRKVVLFIELPYLIRLLHYSTSVYCIAYV